MAATAVVEGIWAMVSAAAKVAIGVGNNSGNGGAGNGGGNRGSGEATTINQSADFFEKRVGEYSKLGVGADWADQTSALDVSF